MISENNKLIQVKISKLAYTYLKKYSDMFNVSISKFCEIAINDRIIKLGVFENEKENR